MFSCEFCKISKNTFSHRTPPVAACVNYNSGYSSLINDYFTYFLCREKDFHHSWIIQYSIFNKNFQRIYGDKDNNSFIDNIKVHKYNVDICTTYGKVYTGSSYQEAFIPDTRIPISQNFTKHFVMAASNIMFVSG